MRARVSKDFTSKHMGFAPHPWRLMMTSNEHLNALVYVRQYERYRFEKWEQVCQHYRRYPS